MDYYSIPQKVVNLEVMTKREAIKEVHRVQSDVNSERSQAQQADDKGDGDGGDDGDGGHGPIAIDTAKTLQEASLMKGQTHLGEMRKAVSGRKRSAGLDSSTVLMLKSTPSYYDKSAQALKKAVESIPAYVEQCQLFLILCPPCNHKEIKDDFGRPAVVDYSTWHKRGWCRAEAVSRLLSTKNTGPMILIRSGQAVSRVAMMTL